MTLAEASELLDFLIDARLSGSFHTIMKEKYRNIYAKCFEGQELSEFLKLVENQKRVPEIEDAEQRSTLNSSTMKVRR